MEKPLVVWLDCTGRAGGVQDRSGLINLVLPLEIMAGTTIGQETTPLQVTSTIGNRLIYGDCEKVYR